MIHGPRRIEATRYAPYLHDTVTGVTVRIGSIHLGELTAKDAHGLRVDLTHA